MESSTVEGSGEFAASNGEFLGISRIIWRGEESLDLLIIKFPYFV